MNVARLDASSVNFNQHIYAIGGNGNAAAKSVECLNLKDPEGKWKTLSPMKVERSLAAAAVLNGLLIIN